MPDILKAKYQIQLQAGYTVCPRCLVQIYIAAYYMKRVMTS